ncbi:MAG TPA: NAD(+)/NADH kinase [Roseiflexaceae bacterium]
MQRIGVLYNPLSEPSTRLSVGLAEWLRSRGLEVWRGLSHEGRDEPEALAGIELLVALGGDGTVLRAARLGIALGIPVLPVAMGRLSFMAELRPEELYDGLGVLLDGGGWHDERTLIAATLHSPGDPPREFTALNEVVVARGDMNRVVMIDIEIYDARLTSYHADGVIVSTATGSTAYALAAGGPIIDPRSRALALVPIAAHLTNLPSLVLHEDAVITLTLRSRHQAAFSADGRESVPLQEGDVVEVRRAAQVCVFARVHPPSTFYERLTQRLRREG